MWMCLTMLLAAVLGILLHKLRVPGGMLVGAVLGAAALNVFTGKAFIYLETRVLAQALTGAYVGCLVTREDVIRLPKLIRPFLTVMACLLMLNLVMAALIQRLTGLDLLTCLLASAPGGLTDITLIAMDMGADASVVAVMQFVRMVFGLSCLPAVIVLADRTIEPEVAKELDAHGAEHHRAAVKRKPATLKGFLPTFCVALCAAVLGKLSGIPAGAMSAALIVTAAMKLSGKCPGMPMWLRRVAQVVSGCCIGSDITLEQVLQLRKMAFPAVILCLGYILCCVLPGLLIHRLFCIELREAMFTLSPAGATDTALIAADLGVESTNLAVLQIGRFISVVVFFPHIFRFILQFV